jgi:hypothetical protein
VNDAEKPYVGLDKVKKKYESSAKREYTSLTSGVNSPNATLDTDSLAKDPLTQERKSYEALAPDKMETFKGSAPTSSSAYVPLSRNNDKDYTGLDSSQRDVESHAIVDYTSLKIDSQNATQASEKCEPSPDTRLAKESYEALNQRELVKSDNEVTAAQMTLTQRVDKNYAALDPSQRKKREQQVTRLHVVERKLQ